MTLAMHRGPDVLKGRQNRTFRLTAMQTPILLDQIFFPGKPIAHTGECLAINGAIDQKLFAEAIQRVVKETDALRVCFSMDGDTVYQEARDLPDYVVEQVNFSSERDPEAAAQTWIEERFWTPIAWTDFPLFHFSLLKIRDDRYVWLRKFNHLVIDGVGRSVLTQRTAEIYEAIRTHAEPAPKIAVSVTETIEAEDSYLLSADHAADRDYWKERFTSLPAPLVKTDRRETDRAKSGRATRLSFDIAPADLHRMKVLAKSRDSSVPRLCLAFAYVALCRLYGVSDLVIGLTQHNRTTEASKQTVGLFMQTMPFRISIGPKTALSETLSEIDRMFAKDRSHARFPFHLLGNMLGLGGTGRGLADVIVNYIPASSLPTFDQAPIKIANLSRGFFTPWLISIVEEDSGARLEIDYDSGLIEAHEAERLAHSLHFLMTTDISDTAQPIGRLPIMNAHEHAQSLDAINQTLVAVPEDATLASLCAEQAERTPHALAVISGTESITYADLHRRASTLASRLAEMGVGPDIVVGIAMPRTIDLVVAVLAVHKAGGAYLPLDPAYPEERIAYILTDARASVILTTSDLAPNLPASNAQILLVDRFDWESMQSAAKLPAKRPALPHHLAYVIYTSGSTGRPKGVSVEHRNVVNLILWARSLLDAEDLAGTLFSTSLNFDISVFQLFTPLCAGGRIILVENLLQGAAAPAWNDVRHIDTVPSLMSELLKIGGCPKHIRTITLAGEPLSRSLADRLFADAPGVRLFNCYGPTEITVYSNWSRVDPADRRPPAIGRPIWNTQLYVLGEDLERLPAGAPGELYVGGRGVTRGYLNRPDLTAERFVENPFGEGRLYRTGDVVRLRADGEIEFLGRTDSQVKIGGLRVELGEIETQLETIPGISAAVAAIQPNPLGVNRLYAYAIPANENTKPETGDVLARLRRVLPRHMIPSALVWMNAFPSTPNGKLDRSALPQLEEPPKGPVHSFRKPRTDIEQALAQIWRQILKGPEVGIDDDFYELGGTSLQAFLIFARIAQELGHDLPPTTMLEASTIARQAVLLRDDVPTPNTSKLIAIRDCGSHSPLFLIHAVFGEIAYARELARHLKSDRPVFGLRPPKLDGTEPVARTMEAIAADYIAEIRAVQRNGPYCLAGHSFGGWVAFEMAQQLARQGETVAFLGLIDTYGKTALKKPEKVAPRMARHVSALHQRPLRDMAAYIGMRIVKNVRYGFAAACLAAQERLPTTIRRCLIKPPSYALRSDLYVGIYRTALHRYTPQPYRGPITTFSAMGLSKFHKQHWQPLALGELTVTEIPGGHQSIVSSPHSIELAASFDACLESATPAIAEHEKDAPPSHGRVAPSRRKSMALT